MYNELNESEQIAVYNFGLANGYDVNNQEVLDDLATQYFELINVNLVDSIPVTTIDGLAVSSSQITQYTQNQIIDMMYVDTKNNLREYEENLVKVSRNSKASPLCIHAQGQVYWVYEPNPKYDRLDDNTFQGSGSSNKLFHPNCRHNMSVYFEGYSDPPLGSGDIDNIENNYKIDQQNKYVEKNINSWYEKKTRAFLVDDPKLDYYNKKHKEWIARR